MKAADIILNQLGGRNNLKAMIGAKEFYSENDGQTLYFKFTAKANQGIKIVKITLTLMDVYTVQFFKITNKTDKVLGIKIPKHTLVQEETNIYNDMLLSTVAEVTGLSLTMPTFARIF